MDHPRPGNMLPNTHESHGGRFVAVITICSVVATVIVGLRFYVRVGIVKRLGADDWALAVALVTVLFSATLLSVATRFGFGSHISVIPLPSLAMILKLIWITSLGYSAAITLLKATVLLQYRRIFPLPNFQRCCDVFIAFVVVWAISGAVGTLLICLPIERNWDTSSPANCGNRIYFWEAYSILHIITDVCILILPMRLLKTIPLPRIQKVVLIAVFCLGFFTCVISAIRITSLRASLTDSDVTWTAPDTAIWSMGEATCAIICVCVPTLRPLAARLYRPWRRPHRVNGVMNYKDTSGRWGEQLSDESGYLETQRPIHSTTNVDEQLRGGISLDRIIPKPSPCYVNTCRVK